MVETRHPCIMDHSPETLYRLAGLARDLSHEVDGHFDDLQDIANLLTDFGFVQEGIHLVDLNGKRIL